MIPLNLSNYGELFIFPCSQQLDYSRSAVFKANYLIVCKHTYLLPQRRPWSHWRPWPHWSIFTRPNQSVGNVCEPKGIFKHIRRAIRARASLRESEGAKESQRESDREPGIKLHLCIGRQISKKGWTQHCFAAKQLNTSLLYRKTLKQGTLCRVCCCRPHPPTTSPPPPPTPPSPSPHPPLPHQHCIQVIHVTGEKISSQFL